jgi:hypothetical protein
MARRRSATTFVATLRRMERDAQRRQRDLQRRSAERARLEERELAELEVELYESRLELLKTVHHDANTPVDWNKVSNMPRPVEPNPLDQPTTALATKIENYRPAPWLETLGIAALWRWWLNRQHRTALATSYDRYRTELTLYNEAVQRWQEGQEAAGIAVGRIVERYPEICDAVGSFDELEERGATVEVEGNTEFPDRIRIVLVVAERDIVPAMIPKVTARGKLSEKDMPKGQANEIFQDYLCGCALRAGREALAVLPVDLVMVDVQTSLLRPETGRSGICTVLSIALDRASMSGINFEHADPSDATKLFRHEMKFKKTAGVEPVESLGWAPNARRISR